MLCQLVPFAIIIWGRAHLWSTVRRKFLLCLLLLVAPVISNEVWLNSLNSPVWFGIATVLLFVETFRDIKRQWSVTILFAIFGLCGPYPSFVLPTLALRAILRRRPQDYRFAGGLLVTTIVQIAIVVGSSDTVNEKRSMDGRFERLGPGILEHHIIEPVTGARDAKAVARWSRREHGEAGWKVGGTLVTTLILLSMFRRPRSRDSGDGSHNYLVLTFIVISVSISLLSLKGSAGGRYGVLPGCTFLVALAMYVLESKPRHPARKIHHALACLALAWSTISGIRSYRDWPYLEYREDSPKWTDEIQRWNEDPHHQPRIWPHHRKQWVVKLRKHT